MRLTPKKNMLEVLYHCTKFGAARILPAAGAAKNVQFFGPIAKMKGPYFHPRLSVCGSLTGTSTLQRQPILRKLGHKDPTVI